MSLFTGGSRGTRKGYNKLAGEESDVNNVNCTAPQCVVQGSSGPGQGPGPGGPDSSDTDSNCTDLELEEELTDDSDYGEYSLPTNMLLKCWLMFLRLSNLYPCSMTLPWCTITRKRLL